MNKSWRALAQCDYSEQYYVLEICLRGRSHSYNQRKKEKIIKIPEIFFNSPSFTNP